MIPFKILLLTQFIFSEFPPYSNSKLTEIGEDKNKIDILRSVEDLLEVVIEENIPKNESITLYYDEEWQTSGLKPGEILRQKSAQYRTWKLLTYRESERVHLDVFGKQHGEKTRSNLVHENMIMYYNYTQCFTDEYYHILNSLTIKSKAIIYISGITTRQILSEWKGTLLCGNIVSLIVERVRKSIFIIKSDYNDMLEIAKVNMEKLPNCAPAADVSGIALWNISGRQKSVWTSGFFENTLPYYCEYPLLRYISHGDTECLINKDDSKGLSTTPTGACMEIIHLVLQKIYSVNQTICQRLAGRHLKGSTLSTAVNDVYINDGSSEYIDLPNLIISNYIGFENVSVILIKPPHDNGLNGSFTNINTNVVLGVLILALAILVASKIIIRYFKLDEFDSSIFLTFMWATTLGFSVPNQPTGKFRIAFIAFVIFSFFLITLYSQHMYTELTVQQETDTLTLEDLKNRNVTKIDENEFHECYNTKSFDAKEFVKCSLGEEMMYVITNKNLLTFVQRGLNYKVLPESFIRPKFIYWGKNMPVDVINILILRATQAGLDQKWKSRYQQKLLEMNEEFDDDEDDEDDDEEDDEEDDSIKPVYVIDLYGPLILIYSLLACSALVFLVEIIVDKIQKRKNEVHCIKSKTLQLGTHITKEV